MLSFYEFFAGGGMARAGLGSSWRCLFANDIDAKKSNSYRENWGAGEIRTGDVGKLTPHDLPGQADLVWGSFPCQDLSLAGSGAGLGGQSSGAFWPFWSLLKALIKDGRKPRLIVLENVCGTLTSHAGKDFSALCEAFAQASYRFGALVMDAALFVPQSRPRLFFVAIPSNIDISPSLTAPSPLAPWHSRGLQAAHMQLSSDLKQHWVWWRVPFPAARKTIFADLIEDDPQDVKWHTQTETDYLLSLMSNVHLEKVENAKLSGKRIVGCVYRRTRINEVGVKVQRAEVRFDDIAGCLRTPGGGSSRQLIIVVEKHSVKSRLISGRETARLMGLSESYILPTSYNETYHLTGDGLAVPVVRHLSNHLLVPILRASEAGLKLKAVI
ncbi:MAG: DNA (cytosine-5-)-methyltransferase [Proteobacteria bacterium]|nr:DNA (cytosine-5-)-methyltransferase [Pseudomonadota bacterium]